MRRFHNPRFAPESLERKLSPSGFVPVPVAAHVYVPALAHAAHSGSTLATAHSGSTLATASAGHGSTGHAFSVPAPDAEPGDPPIDTPVMPNGPDLPA